MTKNRNVNCTLTKNGAENIQVAATVHLAANTDQINTEWFSVNVL